MTELASRAELSGLAPPAEPEARTKATALARALHANLRRILLGTEEAVTVAVLAALSGGHLLIEDVPGVGKTVLAQSLAISLGVDLSRIQGHPDLLPSDVTGVTVYSGESASWAFRPGPVFCHVVLVDELNRTPPRTQSALLETMEERQVSVDGKTWPLPEPHFVIATQNPVGQLGTFPLVESQLDRFALSIAIGYPSAATETELALGHGGREALGDLGAVCDADQWRDAIAASRAVHVAIPVAEYAVAICRATRVAPSVRLGASPRASITVVRSAQARALLDGRDYVSPDDVRAVAVPTLAHRLVTDGDLRVGASVVVAALSSVAAPRP
jgi:MoxR-like ATPase